MCPIESSVHIGAEVGELAVDDCELADDFAKVGVDLDSHVVEVLLGSRFVHGAKCYTGRALGVKHWTLFGHTWEGGFWCYLIR